MATYTYLDMEGLRTYDGLIKQYIGNADAKAIKFGKIENGYLKLYKTENPAEGATPDFNLELPLGNFVEKVTPAAADNIATLNADGTLADGGVKIDALETKAHAGTIPGTATATDITGYAAEVAEAAKTASIVSITQEGLVVTFKQGGSATENVIGTINIPADMVVSDGTVETYTAENLPTGEGAPTVAGTYIVLTLANASGKKIYVNAADLIDEYVAAQGATQVQLAVNGRTLSATLVAGGVGTTELADGAVTTDKLAADAVTNAKLADEAVQTENIKDANVTAAKLATDAVETAKIKDANVTAAKLAADAVETVKIKDANVTAAKLAADSVITEKILDANVTKAKLEADVQTSLGKADSAVQPGDIEVISDEEIEALFK